MKNILMLEDNEKTLLALEQAFSRIGTKINVCKCTTYEEACRAAFSHQIDVFVLDIILTTKVPGDTSGIYFAEQIRKHEGYLFTPIIFITALSDPELYAYRRLHSFGYLEKPFSMEEAVELVEGALKYEPPKDKNKVIYMRKDGILLACKVNEVMYVSANNHELEINLIHETMTIPYMTIKKFLNEADDSSFIQCSRNAVVNKKFIHSVDIPNRYIILENESRVEIGVTFSKKVKQELIDACSM